MRTGPRTLPNKPPREKLETGPLNLKILEYWKTNEPETVAELRKNGKLEWLANKIARSSQRTMSQLMREGLKENEALEFVSPNWTSWSTMACTRVVAILAPLAPSG